jgi:lysophospholipase L1-like esterase
VSVATRATKLPRALAVIAAFALLGSPARALDAKPGWVTAWATSQQALGESKISNATVRQIARVTLPGNAVRIRLDNTFGTAPVTIAHATVAPHARGPAVALGLVKPATFTGKESVTIPAGGTVESDPVALRVEAQEDLAISLFVPGTEVRPSQHNNAYVTSYITDSGAGDETGSEDGKKFTGKITSTFWLKAIDVRSVAPASTVVAFGDSITDGTCSTIDAHDRWEDLLSVRAALGKKVRWAVVNEGIGGNTVTGGANYQPAINSPTGVERLERDVLSHAGVSHVILFLGTNDLRREASVAQVTAGITDIVARVKAKGIKIIGVTILPRHTTVPGIEDTGWSDEKNKTKRAVNDWIRRRAGFDGVLDFDRLVRSRGDEDLIEPAYGCGDGVHPSPFGYFLLAKSIDLGMFRK